MTVNKRKKNSRQRGYKTHGYGSMKKHRGSGHRGGKGMAGTGKRADSKKPSIWKERYFGKYGFKSKSQLKIKPFNLLYIEDNFDSLLGRKIIEKDNDFYDVDAGKLGFNKLLSSGRVSKKFRIRVMYASKNAIEKVKAAGGEVTLLSQSKEA
ncbi:uL15 family ribosomal protein [Candidatus Woesearchaeota archaeon]|nr:ribosomal protein L15 [uncultured archaeon]MBS3102564.1 uL15 family ribosomal protein [Candidatus Woesearchaeota archaeon]